MVNPCSIFAPAKLNLFLAVTGRRADGFHDLVSVVATVGWGDTLRLAPVRGVNGTGSVEEIGRVLAIDLPSP